jgi:hypothetical protein
MTIKVKRTGLPAELEAAVTVHAAAIAAGDERHAMAFVEERAAIAAGATMARLSAMRPLTDVKVIARARLGAHYIVKLRLIGEVGTTMTLQNRWHQESGGAWRLIEIEDAGSGSPWKKPDKIVAVSVAR